MSARDASHLDKLIGRHITIIMAERGVTRAKLARKLGINRYQLQKYEMGENRIPASRLKELSKYVNTGLDYYFKWLPPVD